MFLIFRCLEIEEGADVDFFGYPKAKINDGLWVSGKIGRAVSLEQVLTGDWNLHLTSLNTLIKNFEGYSGSPLFMSGMLVGLLGSQTSEEGQGITVNAVSVDRFQNYLEKNDILTIKEDAHQTIGKPSSADSTTIITLSQQITNKISYRH